jgi:PAS domain S-box-containing protein
VLEDIYEAALNSLLTATAADRAAILTFDPDGVMRFKAWRDLSPEYREAAAGQTPWPQGTQNAQPVVVPDVLIDEDFRPYREIFAREHIGAVTFIPLSLDRGVLGEFILYYADPHECTQDELALAQVIASHVVLTMNLKRAERTASLHLAAIVESSEDAIVSKDLNGIITSWNKGAEHIFGYTADEVVGKPVSILAAPDRIDEFPDILDKIRQGQRVEHYETLRRKKDGQTIHVSLSVSPVRDFSGRIIGASKIARDISDRKRVERERALLLSREQEAGKTAELLNRVALRLAAELDLEKLVQSVTDVATELVGAEFGSFFYNVVNDQGESYVLYTLSGAPREAFANFPRPRNTEVFGPTFRGEGVVRCEDVTRDPRYGKNAPYHGMPKGHLPVRSYLAAPVTSRSGEVLGGLFFGHSTPGKFREQHEAILTGVAAQAAIAMDNARLFEQAQWTQEELKRSNEELRRANQDLETFAYSASHDLQEPLRTIVISAQFLQRRYGSQLQGDASQFLAEVVQGAQRMENLIRDMLAYATATKYAEGPPPSVDPGKVLATVLETLKGPIQQAGATITSAPLPVVSVHESRLAQLFQNLIGNAIKYVNKEAPRVHISAVERDGSSVFSVTDNGIGIDRKFADHIFGLFKRLHNRQEYPGSGIGLAICQRIVEQYGGRIWLENSMPGAGSTFCFSFPTRTR